MVKNQEKEVDDDAEDAPECYFCGFSELTQKHHIIRKSDGGTDEPDNLIILCPNHHYLLHSNLFCLQFTKGILLLRSNRDPKRIIAPVNWKTKKLRQPPEISLQEALSLKKLEEFEEGKFRINSKNKGGFFCSHG